LSPELAFHAQGKGERILFVHGTPTSAYEYVEVFNRLGSEYECLAIDHLGFGDSPKPYDGDYSIAAHRERLRQTLKNRTLDQFHLVVHDFGGVIGIPLVGDPDFRVRSLTILNSWAWPLVETEPALKSQRWLVRAGVLPFLYRYFNFSPRVLLKLAWGKHRPLDPIDHRHYIDAFPTAADRSGTVGFLRALFHFEDSVWQMQAQLRQINIPVQIIWGMKDALVSPKTLARWRVELPNARVIQLPEVGHFVAEEAPELLVEHLRRQISGINESD